MTRPRKSVVIDGPCWKDSVAVRAVELPNGGSRCEIWKDGRWVKGGSPFDLLEASWLKREEFRRYGIPFEVCPEHPAAKR